LRERGFVLNRTAPSAQTPQTGAALGSPSSPAVTIQ
jgi:hypothetical protein